MIISAQQFRLYFDSTLSPTLVYGFNHHLHPESPVTCLSNWELTFKVQVPRFNWLHFVSTVCLKASLNLAHSKPNFPSTVFHPLLSTVKRFQCFPKVHFCNSCPCNSSAWVGQPSWLYSIPYRFFSFWPTLFLYRVHLSSSVSWTPRIISLLATSHPLLTFSSQLWYKGLSWNTALG